MSLPRLTTPRASLARQRPADRYFSARPSTRDKVRVQDGGYLAALAGQVFLRANRRCHSLFRGSRAALLEITRRSADTRRHLSVIPRTRYPHHIPESINTPLNLRKHMRVLAALADKSQVYRIIACSKDLVGGKGQRMTEIGSGSGGNRHQL